LFLAVAYAASPAEEWENFKVTYGKTYSSRYEEAHRFGIFMHNMATANKMNSEQTTATFGVTPFMDLTSEEFAAAYLMPKGHDFAKNHAEKDVETVVSNSGPPPSTYDWRSAGAVTPVYNQQQCGSCWAFSTTEEIESQWFLAGHPLTSLSMQQVVSCDNNDYGCNGGDPPTAYKYVISAGGLEAYSDYPYTSGNGVTGRCDFNAKDIVAKISNWAYVSRSDVSTPNGNETAMLYGSWEYGPLSICVDASSWQTYKGGIITSNCGKQIDHCVQLVGWNTQNGVDYWVVRNSWGVLWGEQGYIYIERNKDLCAIANEVTRAII